jgi:POT family proton-dependent oligopeptide transporter
MSEHASTTQWFGHPRGLATLFFTEMWERFSYYGMRAMLMLFMTAVAIGENPGLGFENAKAGAVYGLYTACAYLLTLPGGWIADRLIGARRAVFVGGAVIAAGNFLLAMPGITTFYLGLFAVAAGTGLLKPNVSTMVGTLYPEGGARRDAGFSIFYMGINLGAFLGPIICGYLGENYNWHWGFAASGVGMVLGLIQYSATSKHLQGAGLVSADAAAAAERRRDRSRFLIAVVLSIVAIGAVWQGVKSGAIAVSAELLANGLGYVILGIFVLYFAYVFIFGKLQGDEWKGIAMIAVLFLCAATFWSGFEQAGSSMNLFADRLTDRTIGSWLVPTSWLQSVNAIFIILLAPVFAVIWQKLGSRDLSMPAKFALGLVLLGIGFLVMMWGAAKTNGDSTQVGMSWLVVAYFLHTCGELCVSPVGLSSVTKLSPDRFVGQMMGIWFMGAAFGNLIAGIAGGQFGSMTTESLFGQVAKFMIGGGVVMGILTLLLFNRWTRDALTSRGMH